MGLGVDDGRGALQGLAGGLGEAQVGGPVVHRSTEIGPGSRALPDGDDLPGSGQAPAEGRPRGPVGPGDGDGAGHHDSLEVRLWKK